MKANTICKYSKCSLGKDGGRKHYYSCSYCAAMGNWRSLACCREHYELYIEEVLAARNAGAAPDLLPERTDLTPEELADLRTRPGEALLARTRQELGRYAVLLETSGLSEAVEAVNRDLDRTAETKTKGLIT